MSTSAELLKELRIDRKAPPSEPPSRRGLWIAVVLVLLLALGVGGWVLFGRGKAIEVTTAPVVAIAAGSSSASVLDASGYVVARRMATVSAKITGKVHEVLIEEGMRVEQNQVMATLDPIDAGAQRQLSASQLDAARSQVTNMQAQLRQAEADAQRLQTLVAQQLVSRSQYEQALSQRDALRAQLQSAQRNVVVAGDQLSISDLNVDNTIVRAPFAGVVTAKAAQPGEIVSPLSAGGGFTRTGIGTVVDMDSLEIEVEVGEAFIGRVKPGMPVEAVLNAYPEWKIPAEVIAIIPSADRGKATVKVRVALKQKDPRIVPEMGVRVSFLEAPQAQAQAQDKPQGVRAPGAAIVKRGGQDVAFALKEDNTVEQRTLKTGIALGDDRQVLSGLAAGDTVVLDPPETLRDGVKVKLAEATEQ
ncbi:efflux RND transporter periplasmic adaptor subunit [Xanthomonas graminis]|jgi:RND family efflux transporter MFP subunit|uniref:Acriflavin resistance protein n=1 Tax=Xanthomonas graminis pv. graminis TaxID=134874 RepID=A0A1M4JMD3_9XANT|nr:efflux RND transporter periplasmic adaptor subunit [Xanthomonas translucens]EKU23531.1 putative RND superfamily multidrug efflux pump component [Xanthomonas translucens pv. graminis ART-Xtg29]OAX61446.1 efflux transporter periplasmic adaptor subunit [Xanthomonas translucens pv. graminis]UKE54428.1 efflux RND transporter periplasmic adaptor subunit [Xanthomonas translucens pv. graminis]WIH08885.1 efflux RND transporter periplasmic adaptor subunit [Xanthomonas translucens pv. graminis]WIH1233